LPPSSSQAWVDGNGKSENGKRCKAAAEMVAGPGPGLGRGEGVDDSVQRDERRWGCEYQGRAPG
jgi:hypothetical protein